MKLSLKLPVRFPPRKPRVAIEIEATLLLPDDGVAPISIKNISVDGFMGETQAEVHAGARVGVALPGCGIVPARVRWNAAGEMGAQFRSPLDLERLQQTASGGFDDRALFEARVVQGPF